MSFTVKKKWFWESTERNLKPDWAFAPSRFEGVAIHEHFLPKACFSTQRGESVRKHAALMAINGSLTENHVETQRAQHAQANSDVKTSKPFAINPITNSKCENWVKEFHAVRTFAGIVAEGDAAVPVIELLFWGFAKSRICSIRNLCRKTEGNIHPVLITKTFRNSVV